MKNYTKTATEGNYINKIKELDKAVKQLQAVIDKNGIVLGKLESDRRKARKNRDMDAVFDINDAYLPVKMETDKLINDRKAIQYELNTIAEKLFEWRIKHNIPFDAFKNEF